ncbi:Zinc finger CCCH domain-containing protein 39 [Hirschfeldia incana]|nr:Zinc finger CCCH domain-containing protein 39 [Hirschfeldia incana]
MDSSYSDSRPYGVWNQTQMVDSTNNELSESQTMPQLKRPRLADDNNNNNTSWGMMVPSSNPPPPPPMNKGTANIFYKTRMCVKFKSGACRNGELCNFAHGMEDLRQPPSNWQEIVGPPVQDREKERERERERLSSVSAGDGNWEDDQKIILRMKLCRKFCFGEECPYGDRCNFIHEDLSKFREENGKLRESLAISVVDPMSVENGIAASHHQVEVNRQGGVSVPAAPMINGGGGGVKTTYWKTRLCGKFEKGQCPFGDNCHFAHGQAELLQHSVGSVEGMNAVPASVSKQTVVPANEPFAMKPTALVTADSSGLNDEGRRKKCLLKWSDSKKINRIYGDWIDDLPVGQKSTKPVES